VSAPARCDGLRAQRSRDPGLERGFYESALRTQTSAASRAIRADSRSWESLKGKRRRFPPSHDSVAADARAIRARRAGQSCALNTYSPFAPTRADRCAFSSSEPEVREAPSRWVPYLDQALRVWGRFAGLDVLLMDADSVSETNCIRSRFRSPTSGEQGDGAR